MPTLMTTRQYASATSEENPAGKLWIRLLGHASSKRLSC